MTMLAIMADFKTLDGAVWVPPSLPYLSQLPGGDRGLSVYIDAVD